MARVCERANSVILLDEIERNGGIRDIQFGARKGMGCREALWREFARQLKNVTLNDRLLWWRWSTKCDSHFQVDQLLAIDYVDVIDKTEMILSHSFATCLFRNKRTSLLKLLLCEKVNEEKMFMLPIFAKNKKEKKRNNQMCWYFEEVKKVDCILLLTQL